MHHSRARTRPAPRQPARPTQRPSRVTHGLAKATGMLRQSATEHVDCPRDTQSELVPGRPRRALREAFQAPPRPRRPDHRRALVGSHDAIGCRAAWRHRSFHLKASQPETGSSRDAQKATRESRRRGRVDPQKRSQVEDRGRARGRGCRRPSSDFLGSR